MRGRCGRRLERESSGTFALICSAVAFSNLGFRPFSSPIPRKSSPLIAAQSTHFRSYYFSYSFRRFCCICFAAFDFLFPVIEMTFFYLICMYMCHSVGWGQVAGCWILCFCVFPVMEIVSCLGSTVMMIGIYSFLTNKSPIWKWILSILSSHLHFLCCQFSQQHVYSVPYNVKKRFSGIVMISRSG